MDDECLGCKYNDSTDITIQLQFCSHCKRCYSTEFERDIHEDLYEPIYNSPEVNND